jgi:hypothetical protein
VLQGQAFNHANARVEQRVVRIGLAYRQVIDANSYYPRIAQVAGGVAIEGHKIGLKGLGAPL